MPPGRRLAYYAYRVAERFGKEAAWFYALPRDEQADYYAFETIREEEEEARDLLLAMPRG